MASLIILMILLIYVLIKRKYRYWKNRNVPYINPVFLLGNTFQRLGLTIPFYKVRTFVIVYKYA